MSGLTALPVRTGYIVFSESPFFLDQSGMRLFLVVSRANNLIDSWDLRKPSASFPSMTD